MKKGSFEIVRNRPLAAGVNELWLQGDTSAISLPGQFVQISLPGFFLRRPFSVSDWDKKGLTVVYKLSGAGTHALAWRQLGEHLDVLTGLGNGFDLEKSGDRPLLVGGGTGASPLLGLCRALVTEGKRPIVALGFGTGTEIFYESELSELAEVHIATMDGSTGHKGLVTELMSGVEYSHFYACGPLPMLRAVEAVSAADGQLSLEARMGCGFGACMGCTMETVNGHKRVCKEGPVFGKGEVLWQGLE